MFQQNIPLPKLRASPVIHRLSKIFQPRNVIPKGAEIKDQEGVSKSQRLMLDLGIIKQASPGTFHFLSLGVRALDKLIKLIEQEMNQIGAQKLILPSFSNAKLWETTGRLKEFGPELFTLHDRHQNMYVLNPTHEEAISNLLGTTSPMSYKEFPLRLYQITNKFRDEIRPRFGLMRGRQFIMKDLYTFDVDLEFAKQTYEEICQCYNNIFTRIGIDFVKVEGTCGTMGGSVSHEYHYVAPMGEDHLLNCLNCQYTSNIQLTGKEKCPHCGTQNIEINQGIEVGHTFLLGEKYTKSFKVNYLSEKGKPTVLQMGCYGIGLSRLLAATIEMLSLEQEIRWPILLAPYLVIIIPPKVGSKEERSTIHFAEKLYNSLETIDSLEDNVLLDDRKQYTIGRRMLDAQRVGYPYIIVIGARATEEIPLFELNDLQKNKKMFLNEDQLIDYLQQNLNVFNK